MGQRISNIGEEGGEKGYEEDEYQEEKNEVKWPDLSCKNFFIKSLQMLPIKEVVPQNEKEVNKKLALSIEANLEEVCFFIYLGNGIWCFRINSKGFSKEEQILYETDVLSRNEKIDFIFTECMRFYKELNFQDCEHLGLALIAFDIFLNFITTNYQYPEGEEKIREYLNVKQTLMEKGLELLKSEYY